MLTTTTPSAVAAATAGATPRFRPRGLPVGALVVLVALVACASACRAVKPHAAGANTLTTEARLRVLDEIWQTVNDEYYDPEFNGVDWAGVRVRYRQLAAGAKDDFEFYGLCELMAAELRDSHTRYEPASPPPAEGEGPPPRGSAGIRLGRIGEEVVVFGVEAGSTAERAGVRPGMTARAVNGRPVGEVIAEIRARVAGASSERSFDNLISTSIMRGRVWGLPRRLTLAGPDGREFDYEVRFDPREPGLLEARRLPSGLAYIRFESWVPPADRRFDEELDKLRDAPALVIDLRGNGGGQSDVLLSIASNFYPAPAYYGGFRTRAGTLDKYFTRKPAKHFARPVAIIVDGGSGSASESFTLFLQETGRARVFGTQSAGSTLNQRTKLLPHGGTLRYSIRAYITPRGRNPEGTGVVPDETAAPTLDDLRGGRDPALAAAEAWLLAGKNN